MSTEGLSANPKQRLILWVSPRLTAALLGEKTLELASESLAADRLSGADLEALKAMSGVDGTELLWAVRRAESRCLAMLRRNWFLVLALAGLLQSKGAMTPRRWEILKSFVKPA